MIESSNPKFKLISKTNSPFSFKVIFSVTNLSPNQIFRFWTFFPNGEPIGNIDFSSNDNGKACNPQGLNEITSGYSASNIIPNGSYIFGVTFSNFVFNEKYNFERWNNLHIPKYYIKEEICFKKETVLTLDEIGSIPWGTYAKVSGYLWFKNVNMEKEGLVWPNGADWLIGRRIYFTGSNEFPRNVETDALSRFKGELKVDNNPEQNCTLQAHYDGDNEYFDKCDSNRVNYSIVKHRTALTIKVDDLKLNPFSKEILRDKIVLEANQLFRLKGKLIDIDFNAGIENQKVNFESNLPKDILSVYTKKDGSFQIDNLNTPEVIGQYYIKSIFAATNLYDSESDTFKFEVIQRNRYDTKIVPFLNHNKSRRLSKKLFLSYANEDLEEAYRIYNYLIKSDIDVWFDKESLLPGQKWEYEIEKQIKETDFIILLLSSISVKKRGYFQKEYKLTLEVLDTIPEGQIYAIPLKLDECEIPHEFKKYHVMDLFPDFEKNLDLIINRIIKL